MESAFKKYTFFQQIDFYKYSHENNLVQYSLDWHIYSDKNHPYVSITRCSNWKQIENINTSASVSKSGGIKSNTNEPKYQVRFQISNYVELDEMRLTPIKDYMLTIDTQADSLE